MRRVLASAALILALGACPDDRLRPVLPPDVLVDTYTQQSAARVDVLWVVDNSESMEGEQQNLARNFQSFIELFVRGAIDYRIAVTTTDIFTHEGRFVGNPAILSPQTGNVITAFQNNIRVGISGSAFEAGLDAAELALNNRKRLNALTLQAPEFLRPEAYLYLIFVSDEEDNSREK